jgi:hypothetical protein
MSRHVLASSLLLGALTPAVADAGPTTLKDFVLTNTSGTTANDLTVNYTQPISTIRSNEILNANGTGTSNNFSKAANSPTPSTVTYTAPTGGQTVPTFSSVRVSVETVAAQLPGFKGLQVNPNPNLTFFTNNGAKIDNSVKLVSADVGLGKDTNTGIVSVSTSNQTGDFLFLSNIEIWTGLTQSQALTFDANDNYDPSGLPTTPTLTPANIDLTPADLVGPTIGLGVLPDDSYVVMLYDLADGPDANAADAVQFGQMVLAESPAAIAPEPGSLALLGTALIGIAVRPRKRARVP